ncbi:hypothetical protein ACFOEK_19970 [Litoribrevibacter euphylliae]|uniref:Uncharacterized protein n=1 Tax=Litoribrevibacter euphylliae TaxID=1834034 RepID=A0ABV7HKV8_9GAMM
MKNKNRAFVGIATLFLIIVVTTVASDRHYRWLVINGIPAYQYANELLAGKASKTPDSLIDKIIIKPATNDIVVFSDHLGFYLYAYSPQKVPSVMGVSWSKLIGSWYVGKLKT